jgi:ribosomal protein S18 acetylase RimI-like enzyme
VPLSAEALQALVNGDVAIASDLVGVVLAPDLASRSHALLNLRLGDLRVNPASGDWLLRAIALRTPDRPMVGLVGFHGPPDFSGSVEVGYEIEPGFRRRGYATEATGTLVRWAFDQNGVRRVTAAIRPDNVASLGVVRRLGFNPAGSRWDAIDGTALLFERRSAPPAQPAAEEGGKMSQQAGS